MNKINFEALPSTKTPLSPSILNTMQENIDEAKLEKTCKTITDWNTAVETGFVQTGTGIANGPAGVDYAGGFVLKRGAHILQYAIASRTGVMYTRSSLDGVTWQDWAVYETSIAKNVSASTDFNTLTEGRKILFHICANR